MILRLSLCFFLFILFVLPARADNVYAEPNFDNIAHTLVRFNAIDINDDTLLDEYAMITDCGLFTHFFPDDFKWNEVRKAIRESVRLNIATFPTAYHYDTAVELGRYDFKYKSFQFKDKATIKGVNAFILYQGGDFLCGKSKLMFLPTTYHAVLDQPVTIDGLPIGADDGEALLKRLDEAKNLAHVIYARFHLRVVNIDQLRAINKFDGKQHYTQDPKIMNDQMKIDVRLDSVNFYEDREMTRLLYIYRL